MAESTMRCELVTHEHRITFGELCRSCGAHAEWVTLLVEEGVLEPQSASTRASWTFAARELPRAHAALRLQRDLGLNVSGIALALELLEENRALREKLTNLSAGREHDPGGHR